MLPFLGVLCAIDLLRVRGRGCLGGAWCAGGGGGGAGRERRRCGLAGASARRKMTRGLAGIPVLHRSKQCINDRRPLITDPMSHWFDEQSCSLG